MRERTLYKTKIWDGIITSTKLQAVETWEKSREMGNCFRCDFVSAATGNVNSDESRFLVPSDDESNPDGRILAIPNLIIFSFKELKIAARNFKPDAALGEGSFGKVFKGWLNEKQQQPYRSTDTSRTAVAIKKLNPVEMTQMRYHGECQREIEFLWRLSHPNLVKLIGYCWNDSELLLVHEYAQRGSLEDHLIGGGSIAHPLSWELRIEIATGTARAFVFLIESDDRVVHRNIKPSNILLDGAYNVKVSDFGLASFEEHRDEGWCVTFTSGYKAPEYMRLGRVNVKSDVYSFGVVLVELLTGLRAYDRSRPAEKVNIISWIKPHSSDTRMLKSILDSKMGDHPFRAAMDTAKLALNCLGENPETRPSMNEVFDNLERIQAIH